jgi:hypothetical protein
VTALIKGEGVKDLVTVSTGSGSVAESSQIGRSRR